MVSGPEALRVALRDGILERKRRAGYWTKRQFVLTPTHLMYFENLEAKEPSNSFATMEIMAVQRSSSDPQQRVFTLVLFKKKKEYRARNTEERDLWMEALESVSGMKGTGVAPVPAKQEEDLSLREDPALVVEEKESRGDRESGSHVQDVKDVDLRALSEQMKKAFSWQIQISKSFSSKDVAEFVKKTLPLLTTAQIQEVGQGLIDQKLIIPLKSHIFDVADPGRFKFVEAAAPKQPKNHLNMRGPSIANLMGNDQFNARKYAEDFLRKHAPQKIESHCMKLVAQKENTIEDLKEEISANYTSFIRAADEIKTMENSVSQLKALVLECRRTMHTLKGIALEAPPEKMAQRDFKAVDKKAEERKQSMTLDEFIRDLEVYLYERNYEQFTHHMLEHKRKVTQGIESATEAQQAKIDELRHLLVEKLVDEFNASLQTSERMHKKENHLDFLIQLGETQLATEMCLQNYSVRIALQLRHVPSYGNALNYVINFSRTFFTSLLVCYEDYAHSFRGQKSSHFISLTVWISAQLEHFASEVTYHIFPDDPSASSTRSSSAVGGASLGSASCVAIDVSEFKSVAKYVSSALRYVFYGSRQLELAGLPTAHYLAPHLARGLVSFFTSYCIAIKNTIREEIKRERWEMTSRMIRDPENKMEREIILTQSARSFYTLVQQFLRDVQRVMNPSCATSNLAEVHEVVVWEADELLVRYSFEELQYLESPKLSSSLRPKHIIGILTNATYIQDDCAARSTNILQEYLPRSALQNREVEAQNSALWDKLVAVGVKRCAQSLMKMSFSWQAMELADEPLPDVSATPETLTTSLLFAGVVAKELTDVVTNNQLNKAVRSGNPVAVMQAVPNGDDIGKGGSQASFAAMVLCALLREMLDDEPWWQNFSGKGGAARKRLGYGGVNQFLAEIQALQSIVPANKDVEALASEVDKKMVEIYQQLHPGKKDVRAPAEWTQAYIKRCIPAASLSTR
ncbi:endocytosis defective- protein [Phytophthora pseudosyringae]|uniref:Endocytosis defective- protein n=1 Tax=Phytophthora pseudosyringae TaxID=221518 RepID=A0A8T1W103_9STRA|nr:endocytosis defective- protein [Phytophthora pseudosyringae]